MYEEFFGLKEKPFSIQPDPSFLYWGRSHRLAYAMLEYGVLNHAGISVISGEVGCGKTTLIHRLLDQLSDTHAVALLSNIQAGRGDLLSWVLMAFGQPYAGKTHVELFAQLQDFFISQYAKGRRVILIIDEAQNLSVDMLEELRMLSNINAGKDQLLQLILVGQPQLKDLLNRPDMLQLAQRIGSDFHLTPLSRQEVDAYIDTRLTIAGATRRIFTEEAVDVIAEQSGGVPRVINIIADTALVYAFSAQDAMVDAETVRDVVRDKFEFGVFGIAAQTDVPHPAASAGDGPEAFVRKATKNKPAASAPAPAARPLLKPASRASDDEPRMPPRRKLQPQPAARAAASALAEPETAPDAAPVRPQLEEGEAAVLPAPTPHKLRLAATAAAEPMLAPGAVGVVVAGDNAAVEETIMALRDQRRVVYVVEAEQEGLADAASRAGADVLTIADRALSPGRARNAGYRELKKRQPDLKYVLFIEAGFAVDPDWLSGAVRFLERRPEVAVLDGGVGKGARQGAPDSEEIPFTGRTAIVRAETFESAGGFRGDLVVNEMVDLCVRLRRRGAHVWRLGASMGDRVSSTAGDNWWTRAMRRGFEYAHGADLHGAPPEQLFRAEQLRAVVWGAVTPLLVILAAGGAALSVELFAPEISPYLAAGGVLGVGAAIYLVKIIAGAVRRGAHRAQSWAVAFATTLGHFPEFFGAWRFHSGGARVRAPARR